MPEKEKIALMFNQISGVYDLANHLLSFGMDFLWRKRCARELERFQPKLILDMASGTADLAIAIHKKNPEAIIIGIDIAEEMLKIAVHKISSANLEKTIFFSLADIEEMPFPEHSFDAITIAFGIRNLKNRKSGLDEGFRVLKPGGILAILEFRVPEKGICSALYGFYLRFILPGLGRLISGKFAYFYLRDSIKEFPAPEQFIKELENAGFSIKVRTPMSRGIVQLYLAQKPEA